MASSCRHALVALGAIALVTMASCSSVPVAAAAVSPTLRGNVLIGTLVPWDGGSGTAEFVPAGASEPLATGHVQGDGQLLLVLPEDAAVRPHLMPLLDVIRPDGVCDDQLHVSAPDATAVRLTQLTVTRDDRRKLNILWGTTAITTAQGSRVSRLKSNQLIFVDRPVDLRGEITCVKEFSEDGAGSEQGSAVTRRRAFDLQLQAGWNVIGVAGELEYHATGAAENMSFSSVSEERPWSFLPRR